MSKSATRGSTIQSTPPYRRLNRHPTWIYDTGRFVAGEPHSKVDLFINPLGSNNQLTYPCDPVIQTWTRTNLTASAEILAMQLFEVRSVVISLFSPTNGVVPKADLAGFGWGYFGFMINQRPFPDYIQLKQICGGANIVTTSSTAGCFGDGTIDNNFKFNPFLTTLNGSTPFHIEMGWDTAFVPTQTFEATVIIYGYGSRVERK